MKRIDLRKHVFDEGEKLESWFAEDIARLKETAPHSIYRSVSGERTEAWTVSQQDLSLSYIEDATLYYNFNANPQNSSTMRIYREIDKSNANRVHIPGYKMELQITGKKVGAQYALGENKTVSRLIETLEGDQDALREVFERVLEHQIEQGRRAREKAKQFLHRVKTIIKRVWWNVTHLIGGENDWIERSVGTAYVLGAKRKGLVSHNHGRDPPPITLSL